MQINDIHRIQNITNYAKQYNNTRSTTNHLSQNKIDEVEISDVAFEMANRTEHPEDLQQRYFERNARINEVKQSLQNGTYNVDTSKLAKKIYDSIKINDN